MTMRKHTPYILMSLMIVLSGILFMAVGIAKPPSLFMRATLIFDAIKMEVLPKTTHNMDAVLKGLRLPPGFIIEVYADNVPGARSLALAENGVVFVGTRTAGKVYAILPKTKDAPQKTLVIADGLSMPNGVAYEAGDLYVAENQRIIKFEGIMAQIDQALITAEVIYDQLPDKWQHGWRYLAVGPDEKLYVSIGAPCNHCQQADKQFATIARLNKDGRQFELVAEGVRNSVGFTFAPKTDVLWFTDNGRDWLGDDLPPDELNVMSVVGMHYGFPYVYGDNQPDTMVEPNQQHTYIAPVYHFKAHVAALGLRFYTATQFPADYHGNLFIALHGSWNRTKKVGYKVLMLSVDGQSVTGAHDFVSGWLQNEQVFGRPVDVLVNDEGSLLISDDYNGVVYIVRYARPG